MAARKPARRSARRRPAPRPKAKAPRTAKATARRPARLASRSRAKARVAKKAVRTRRIAAKPTPKRVVRSARPPRTTRKKPTLKSLKTKTIATKTRPAPVPTKAHPPRAAAAPHPPAPPTLTRERRRLSDLDLLDAPRIQSEVDARADAAAHSGGLELQHAIERHTEAGPSLTAGDIDARWDDAYAVGDEAPGGDNPTPDQDRVDDIGKALGVVYADGEELQGSDKIAERDLHRWELDPASSDDWPHKP